MALTGLDPERAARLSALTAELQPLLASGTEMPAIQEMLSVSGIGVMDSIVVTRELLDAGPDALGLAKTLVLSSPTRQVERKQHQKLLEDLVDALDQIDAQT